VPVVKELGQPPSEKLFIHYVDQGETLYSIAWRHNLDVYELAKANNIDEPYRLRVGQKINLHNQPIKQQTASKRFAVNQQQIDSKVSQSASRASNHQETKAWLASRIEASKVNASSLGAKDTSAAKTKRSDQTRYVKTPGHSWAKRPSSCCKQ